MTSLSDKQTDLLLKPAYKLAELVRQRKLSSVELIDLALKKISIEKSKFKCSNIY